VFIEPASAASGRESTPSGGPINAYAHQVGEATVTVVGEIPFSTARSVAQAAERIGR
jgi:negative regulator of sigma E activity